MGLIQFIMNVGFILSDSIDLIPNSQPASFAIFFPWFRNLIILTTFQAPHFQSTSACDTCYNKFLATEWRWGEIVGG